MIENISSIRSSALRCFHSESALIALMAFATLKFLFIRFFSYKKSLFPKIKPVNFSSKVQKGVSHLPDDLESTKFPPRELFGPLSFFLGKGC